MNKRNMDINDDDDDDTMEKEESNHHHHHSSSSKTVGRLIPIPPCASLFEKDLLRSKCFNENDGNDGNEDLTILDYTIDNALLYSQGSWLLIRRDLFMIGISEECIDSLEDGPCHVLIQAFHVRRELIHYKKLCLHLLAEARKMERELQQCMSYFYTQDENVEEGTWIQLQALLLDSSSTTKNDNNNETINELSLLEKKRLYLMACRAWMRHKGITRALQDARDITKAICLSPRHPDKSWERRPTHLKNMPLSMNVTQLCQSSERQNPSHQRGPSRYTTNNIEIKMDQMSLHDTQPGHVAMNDILQKVKIQLNWPPEAIDFLQMSMAARGGFKALAIAKELNIYCQCLSQLPQRLEMNIQTYQTAQTSLSSRLFSSVVIVGQNNAEELKNYLSAAAQTDGQIHVLNGALEACRENYKWMHILTQRINTPEITSNNNKNTRLFLAGDDVAKFNSCAFVPHDFQLGNILKSSRETLDTFLLPTMHVSILEQEWPPSANSRRTRVRAFPATSLIGTEPMSQTMKKKNGFNKFQKCRQCKAYFDKIWIRHDLCTICEATCRRDGNTTYGCIFDKCKNKIQYFCPHSLRCFVCDAPHSCPDLCRLTRGDGEIVSSLVETLQPNLLLLDFDRTLCSTKSGASPLPPNWNNPQPPQSNTNNTNGNGTSSHDEKKIFKKCHKKRNKDDTNSFQHTLDEELKKSIVSQQVFGKTYIVTRNSHKEEIQEFLRRQGLSAIEDILVVPKKVPKGEFIKTTFYNDDNDCSSDPTSLFIDDDINELVNNTWLRESKSIHRVIFVRAI